MSAVWEISYSLYSLLKYPLMMVAGDQAWRCLYFLWPAWSFLHACINPAQLCFSWQCPALGRHCLGRSPEHENTTYKVSQAPLSIQLSELEPLAQQPKKESWNIKMLLLKVPKGNTLASLTKSRKMCHRKTCMYTFFLGLNFQSGQRSTLKYQKQFPGRETFQSSTSKIKPSTAHTDLPSLEIRGRVNHMWQLLITSLNAWLGSTWAQLQGMSSRPYTKHCALICTYTKGKSTLVSLSSHFKCKNGLSSSLPKKSLAFVVDIRFKSVQGWDRAWIFFFPLD